MTNLVTRIAHEFIARQRQRRSVRILSALPRDLQKDIGWPAASADRILAAGPRRDPHSPGRY